MRDCGCKPAALVAPKRDVRADARDAFARQARALVEEGDPDAIKAAIERFEHPRYALVADEALAILGAA